MGWVLDGLACRRSQVTHEQSAPHFALLTGYRKNIWVSLKIIVADTCKGSKELQNIQRISQLIQNRPGSWLLCLSVDYFFHEGPNGKHLCLVNELLGPTLYNVLDYYNFEMHDKEYLSQSTVLKISKQLLEAVALLHSVGFPHGGTSSTPVFLLWLRAPFSFPSFKLLDSLSLTLSRSEYSKHCLRRSRAPENE